MSQENLEIVRSIYAEWDHGDFSSLEWAAPEIEYVIVDGPEPGSWSGAAAMAATMRSILNAWENARIEADEYIELDDERVLVLNHLTGRGKASGLEVGQMKRNGAAILHCHDGKVTRYVSYNDRDRALADLGLGE
jgi:ketosteroid isomerase-like protein